MSEVANEPENPSSGTFWTSVGRATTRINGPAEDVFLFLAHPAHQRWVPFAERIKATPEGPIGVGTIFAPTGKFWRSIGTRSEVTRYQPGQLVGLAIPPRRKNNNRYPRCRMHLIYNFEPIDVQTTSVSLLCVLEIKGFLKALFFIPLLLTSAIVALLLWLTIPLGGPTGSADADLAPRGLGYFLNQYAAHTLFQWKRGYESTTD